MRRTILGWLLLAVSAERLLNVYLLSRHPSIFEQVEDGPLVAHDDLESARHLFE